jgi:hypothetical protein
MKLGVLCSSLDLRNPLSSTPSWWQLLKALAESGVDLLVAPYQGPPIESPWWTALDNPCQVEGNLVGAAKASIRRFKRGAPTRSLARETLADRATRHAAQAVTRPRWQRYLSRVVETQRDIDAFLFLTVPPNQVSGIAHHLMARYGVPTYFYDGDVPASLPSHAGFQSGFRIYQGADVSEYAGFFSNSLGGMRELRELGARNVRLLYYAADPDLFRPREVEQDIDVFFYGHGREYREEWIDQMIAMPSRGLPNVRFAVRGTHLGNVGAATHLAYASLSRLGEYCARSKVNLLITRDAHASMYASSTARPFELAAQACAMVSNPYQGIQEWFEPGSEVLVVGSEAEARAAYGDLLGDPGARKAMGERARKRLLAQHTYAHRAAEIRNVLGPSR